MRRVETIGECLGTRQLLLSSFLLLNSLASAMITIAETKQQLGSRVDRSLGEQLLRRREYLARLQYVSADPQLCGKRGPYTILKPADDYPVALVVRSGGCTVAQKAYAASNLIRPAGLVHYLIVDDSDWTQLDEQDSMIIGPPRLHEEEGEDDAYSYHTDEDWSHPIQTRQEEIERFSFPENQLVLPPPEELYESKEDAYPYHQYLYSLYDDDETGDRDDFDDEPFLDSKGMSKDYYGDDYEDFSEQSTFYAFSSEDEELAVPTEDDFPWKSLKTTITDEDRTSEWSDTAVGTRDFSNDDESVQVPPEFRSNHARSLRQSHHRNHDSPAYDPTDGHTISVAIFHVSYSVGSQLFNIIYRESRPIKSSGGTAVWLDSRDYNPVSAKAIFLWVLLSATLSACACCCFLLFLNRGVFEEETAQPPPRPVRRRLTHEQVRTKYPAFVYYPEEHATSSQTSPQTSSDELQSPSDPSRQPLLPLSAMASANMMEDDCAICLDEFSPGVSCRQLPCQHVFHATCIARWLIERSATCPLCKIDLYEDDEAEEASEQPSSDTQGGANETATATASSFMPAWWGSIGRTAQDPPGRNENDTTEPPAETRWSTLTSPWWQQRQPQTTTDTTPAVANAPQPSITSSSSWWRFSRSTPSPDVLIANASDDHSTSGDDRRGRWWSILGGRRQPNRRSSQRVGVTELTEPLLVTSSSNNSEGGGPSRDEELASTTSRDEEQIVSSDETTATTTSAVTPGSTPAEESTTTTENEELTA